MIAGANANTPWLIAIIGATAVATLYDQWRERGEIAASETEENASKRKSQRSAAENQQHDAADLHGKVGGSREPAVLALPARDGAILSGMEGLIGDRRTRGPADQ